MAVTLNASTSAGFIQTADTSGVLQLQTANTTAMTLDATQKVGIGTTTPRQTLSLGATLDLYAGGANAPTVPSIRGSAANNLVLNAYSTGITYINFDAGSGGMIVCDGAQNALMTLSSSGNLGLGVAPSAWGTSKALQIGQGAIWNYNGVNNIYVGANYYYNGTNRIRIASGYAGEYLINGSDGAHSWYTAGTSTAGSTVSFTQAMTLDASGRLGIATTGPNAPLHILAADAVTADLARFQQTNQGNLLIQSQQGGQSIGGANGILFSNSVGNMGWRTNASSGNAQMLLDTSGNLLVGTTSLYGAAGLSVIPNASAGAVNLYWNRTATTSTSTAATFSNGGTPVGTITYTNTAVAYNTGPSDYRLKDEVSTFKDGLAAVQAMRPVSFKWKGTGALDIGFIAHELQQVIPAAVSGEKDKVNDDGSPAYQSVFPAPPQMIATLVSAIQEQQDIITQLTERISALENK